jgi:hypothetical protein
MAFKMKGSPATTGRIHGTAGYRSALKKAVDDGNRDPLNRPNQESSLDKIKEGFQNIIEPFKPIVQPYIDKGKEIIGNVKDKLMGDDDKKPSNKKRPTSNPAYDRAKKNAPNINELIKNQKKFKKGSPEWNANQNKINEAYGVKKRYPVAETTTPKTEEKTKPTKTEKVIAKGDKKIAEVKENVSKRTAKISMKDAKKQYGKNSKEYLEAKKRHLEAKEADRQGSEGGKKQTFFRKISSNINRKRQEKIDKKLSEME